MDNSAQIEYWNGRAGQKWVRDADRMDVMLAPFADAIISKIGPTPGQSVIDVGCGAGALSLNVAASSVNVSVFGVDVSEPLVAVARARAGAVGANAEFVVADAATWRPENAADFIISRFGIMFFADPVAAFANMRQMLKPEGRMSFACWRALSENDWAMTPLRAALPLLPEAPMPPPPGTPGPFAFAEQDYVQKILADSGWSDIRITPWNGDLTLPGTDAAETADFMLDMGPLARAIADQAIELGPIRAAVEERLKELASPDGRIHLKAAAWIVEARA